MTPLIASIARNTADALRKLTGRQPIIINPATFDGDPIEVGHGRIAGK
jgi:hypothetical protein